MPKNLADVSALEAVVAPVCEAEGLELVTIECPLEQGGPVLRVLVELPNAETLPKGENVTLEHCTRVSRKISLLLDEDAVSAKLPSSYRLEVSSPGVERPLVKPRDFERYAGREVQLSTKAPVLDANAHERKKFTGTLLGLNDDRVLLRVAGSAELAIPFIEIAKAHLVFRF